MTDLTPQAVAALAETARLGLKPKATWQEITDRSRAVRDLHDLALDMPRLIAAQAAEIERLRGHLTECLDWMEDGRASGDWGNWDWDGDSEYTRARAELEGAKP